MEREIRLKIDLHMHTSERSSCSEISETRLIKKAIKAGLDAIVITDHWKFVPQETLARFQAEYPMITVFSGIEITANDEDILVYGIRDARLEKRGWRYADLHQFVRQNNGALVLAHPFRFHDQINIDLQKYPPDAIEICSNNIPLSNARRIFQAAERLHLPLLGNSDAHGAAPIGKYFSLFDHAISSDEHLVAALRAGDFSAAYRKGKKMFVLSSDSGVFHLTEDVRQQSLDLVN